jgi:hypothetical protein
MNRRIYYEIAHAHLYGWDADGRHGIKIKLLRIFFIGIKCKMGRNWNIFKLISNMKFKLDLLCMYSCNFFLVIHDFKYY